MGYKEAQIEILVMGLVDSLSIPTLAQIQTITGRASDAAAAKSLAMGDVLGLLHERLVVVGPEDPSTALVQPWSGSPEEVLQKFDLAWGEKDGMTLSQSGGIRVGLSELGVERAEELVREHRRP